MWTIWQEILRVLNASAVYLLMGFLAAGVLNILLDRYRRLTDVLTTPGSRPVYLAAIIGAPLPLCSCSVLPTALTLRRQGATKGATASFLISVPETDVISIILTYVLIGPLFAVVRPVAALITAIVTGLVVNRVEGQPSPRRTAAPTDAAGNGTATADSEAEQGCGCHTESCEPESKKRGWWVRALHFGFVEMFDDIIVQIFIGVVVGGAIIAWLPALGLEGIVGDSPLTYLVMLGIGIPVYVCATASTPLAVGLMAGGVSPGAALVFLLAGPATNIGNLLVISREFGRRVFVAYMVSVAVVSVALGIWLDAAVGPGFHVKHLAGAAHAGGASPLQIAGTIVLVVLFAVSVRRMRLIERVNAGIGRRLGVSVDTRKLIVVLLGLVAACYLSSGFFMIQPGHRGVVKRFGRVEQGYLGPGLHYRWPLPFERADIEAVNEIKTVEIGFRRQDTEAFTPVTQGDEDPLVEEAWMLSGDENIIDIQCIVHYQIIDSEDSFLNYLYAVKDKSTLVRNAAEWALRSSVATRSIDSLLTVDRGSVEEKMRDDLLQPRLDECESGIRVVNVNLRSVHAPAPVHWAFRDVASAVEDQRQVENLARGYEERTTLVAEGEAARIMERAAGAAADRVQRARGDGAAFQAQSLLYNEAPVLTETRLYLEWIDKFLPGMNKYVDLMPRDGGGSDVWLRMGSVTESRTHERADSVLPWFWQREDTP